MDPLALLQKYYKPDSLLYSLLLAHSEAVSKKALAIARNNADKNPDLDFIYEAAMLHDIGVFLTYAPNIHCYGKEPYICHGYLGNSLLQQEGYPKHGLVCERHTGAGLDVRNIIIHNLPLPHRDMMPLSVEEQIICLADSFFSKSSNNQEKSLSAVRKGMAKHGEQQLERFDHLCALYL